MNIEDRTSLAPRLLPRKEEQLLYDTPKGKQPYRDFWYDNAWDAAATYNGTLYGQYGEWVNDDGAGTYIDSDFHHNGVFFAGWGLARACNARWIPSI